MAADPTVALQHYKHFPHSILHYSSGSSGRSNLAQLYFPHLISQLLSQEQHRTRIPGAPVQSCPPPNFDTLWKKIWISLLAHVPVLTPYSCYPTKFRHPVKFPQPPQCTSKLANLQTWRMERTTWEAQSGWELLKGTTRKWWKANRLWVLAFCYLDHFDTGNCWHADPATLISFTITEVVFSHLIVLLS